MATNLRLSPEAEKAVRDAATSTGQSQQQVIREAVDRHLGLARSLPPRDAAEAMMATQGVLPARSDYGELDVLVILPRGMSTEDLLDRSERF